MPSYSAPGANNVLVKDTATVGVTSSEVLKANKARVAYRIYASLSNDGNLFLGYEDSVSTTNTYIVIGRGDMFEDSGYYTCYKGPVYLISGVAGQSCIVEEVILIGGRR